MTHIFYSKIFLYIKTGLKIKNIKPQIRDAQIKIDENCNSKCITCNIWKNKTKKEMSQKTFLKVLKELKKVGLKSVCLTGGEPLLHRQLAEFCRIVKENGLKLNISTNGLLLLKKIDKISDYVDQITISLDGLEKTNDKIRGIKGYYQNAIKSIKYIHQKYPSINMTMSTTITDNNFKEIKKLIIWCSKNKIKWSPNILTNSLYFFKNTKINGLKPKKNKNDIFKFKQTLINFQKTNVVEIPKIVINHLTNLLIEEEKKYPCCLGLTNAFIDSNGNYYSGCWALPPIGNLTKQNIKQIINSNIFKNRIQKMSNLNCPKCTCGYDQNYIINNYHLYLSEKIKNKIFK